MALIEGEGTDDAEWLAWLPAACEARGLGDWLGPEQRLVVVAPHPDDEVLACGGLLAMHAARGGACLVVAVTDGEACDAGLDADAVRRLAGLRRAESEAGLGRLGLDPSAVERLGLPDGAVAAREDDAARALSGLLRAGDVLVTTWRHDGHPDHEATGRAAARAAADAGARLVEAPVWMWHWARPDDPRVPWHRLAGLALGEAAGRAKAEALACHRSQLAARSNGQGPVLGDRDVARSRRRHEHYFL